MLKSKKNKVKVYYVTFYCNFIKTWAFYFFSFLYDVNNRVKETCDFSYMVKSLLSKG